MPRSLLQAAPTEITISDDILVADTIRLGVNFTDDTYFSGAVLTKMRIVENFEGALFRRCHFGSFISEDGVATWFGKKGNNWYLMMCAQMALELLL